MAAQLNSRETSELQLLPEPRNGRVSLLAPLALPILNVLSKPEARRLQTAQFVQRLDNPKLSEKKGLTHLRFVELKIVEYLTSEESRAEIWGGPGASSADRISTPVSLGRTSIEVLINTLITHLQEHPDLNNPVQHVWAWEEVRRKAEQELQRYKQGDENSGMLTLDISPCLSVRVDVMKYRGKATCYFDLIVKDPSGSLEKYRQKVESVRRIDRVTQLLEPTALEKRVAQEDPEATRSMFPVQESAYSQSPIIMTTEEVDRIITKLAAQDLYHYDGNEYLAAEGTTLKRAELVSMDNTIATVFFEQQRPTENGEDGEDSHGPKLTGKWTARVELKSGYQTNRSEQRAKFVQDQAAVFLSDRLRQSTKDRPFSLENAGSSYQASNLGISPDRFQQTLKDTLDAMAPEKLRTWVDEQGPDEYIPEKVFVDTQERVWRMTLTYNKVGRPVGYNQQVYQTLQTN